MDAGVAEYKHQKTTAPRKRKYSGPAKGSEEAKRQMERVRAAQWAKNNLVVGACPRSTTSEAPERNA